ncbi:MAG: PEGA domain-containing protein, partial [Myxococcales bacterium]|nr:PEGA domain-containing protein [Myxococcales bacterium]
PPSARLMHQGRTYESGSPYELRLPAGRVAFRVAKTGFESAEREVPLRGGQTTEITVALERERERPAPSGMGGGGMTTAVSGPPGTLTFDARPWCNVSIDGQSVGQTPIVNRSISAGSHRITCTNPDLGVTRNLNVDVAPGQPTRQRINLQ